MSKAGKGKRNTWCALLTFGLWVFGVAILPSPAVQAKWFTDSLPTDFQGGQDENIQILQNLQSGIQLAPFNILRSWTSSSGPTDAIYHAASFVHNGKVYVLGGKGSSDSNSFGQTLDTALNTIHFGNILPDGSIEKWDPEEQVKLPQPTFGHAAVVLNGRAYILGGRTANSTLDAVYSGKILGHDGMIKAYYQSNTWTAVASLPKALFRPAALTFEGRIYVLGGMDADNIPQNLVYYADVEPNGNIPRGGWVTSTSLLPTPLAGHNAILYGRRIYIIGGSTTGEPRDMRREVFFANLDANGNLGAWTATAPLPEPLFDSAAVMSFGRIWVCGGTTSATAKATNVVYNAGVDYNTGEIPTSGYNTWSRATDLPIAVRWHNLVAQNGHLILIGGANNAGTQKQVYTTTLVKNFAQNQAHWLPTTPLFLSPYGGGVKESWVGHTMAIKVPLPGDSFSSSDSTQPTVHVLGGGPNTYNAYSTIYKSNVDSNGSLQTWASDPQDGELPIATVLHSTAVALNNQIYVIGGVNSNNAGIFRGGFSRSPAPYENNNYFANTITALNVGLTEVLYETAGTGSTGSFEETSSIPLFDPQWASNTTPVYQPLIRAAATAYNDTLYVLGGISRRNTFGGGFFYNPTGSQPDYTVGRKVWYCRPNPGGAINPLGAPGTWTLTTSLPIDLYDLSACVAYNRVYVFGGRINAAGTTTSQVHFAPILPNGSLGTWTSTTDIPQSTLGFGLAEHSVVFTSGRFYVLGGSRRADGTEILDNIYFSVPHPQTGEIPSGGNFGAWELSTTLLNEPTAGAAAGAYNGYLYLLGGRTSAGATPVTNAYYTTVAEAANFNLQSYANPGYFEKYVDLERDQYVENLNWEAETNSETLTFKLRTALEKGAWTAWTPEQTAGPIPVQRTARYVHYKISFLTFSNESANARTPLVKQVSIQYTISKQVEEDSLMINHNRFDPQREPLMITFKTRNADVSNAIIRIYNLEGELIQQRDFNILPGTPLPTTGFWSWDGTNSNGEMVANGVYLVQFNSGDTYKIRKVAVIKR